MQRDISTTMVASLLSTPVTQIILYKNYCLGYDLSLSLLDSQPSQVEIIHLM